MREPYVGDGDLDALTIRIRRPPGLRHYQPLFVLASALTVAAGVWLWQGAVPRAGGGLGLAGLLYAASWLVFRATPAEHHTVVLSGRQVEVDGRVFDVGSVGFILTDEKLVLRDRDHQAEIWHGIPRNSERMRLRKVLDGAIESAKDRYGRGVGEVPADLHQVRETT